MNRDLCEEVNRLHVQVCSGLADPNRILMRCTLAEQPRNVTEPAEISELPQPTVSRHLKILRQRGMVAADRHGQSVSYSLGDERIIEVLDILRAVLADRSDNQMAMAREAHEALDGDEQDSEYDGGSLN